jgi:hypothetical protein
MLENWCWEEEPLRRMSGEGGREGGEGGRKTGASVWCVREGCRGRGGQRWSEGDVYTYM